MKIYDISQEVFGCQVYAGDPAPEKELLSSMEEGGLYNLTAFRMCAHNGTHIDAPFHFIQGGKTVDSIDLDTFVGLAYVAEHHGIVSADDAAAILENANKQNPEAAKRILIKGDAEVSSEAATVFAASNMLLLGNESQTVGPENAPMEVHRILLGAGIVLLEGIRLTAVSEGVYFLNAAGSLLKTGEWLFTGDDIVQLSQKDNWGSGPVEPVEAIMQAAGFCNR